MSTKLPSITKRKALIAAALAVGVHFGSKEIANKINATSGAQITQLTTHFEIEKEIKDTFARLKKERKLHPDAHAYVELGSEGEYAHHVFTTDPTKKKFDSDALYEIRKSKGVYFPGLTNGNLAVTKNLRGEENYALKPQDVVREILTKHSIR